MTGPSCAAEVPEASPTQLDADAAAAAAGLLEPLLPVERRRVVADAAARARLGHARVLVLGEAKRGKSTLVNALYGQPLLPTGALPLTSVPTVVAAGPGPRAEVRHRDGSSQPLDLHELAAAVSEKGNPGNTRGIDRVLVTAPTAWLPPGTEVVDTPGTGSVHVANTDEAHRAMLTLDVAIPVVAADPPLSDAEVELLGTAMSTASRAAVVVNKADLVSDEALVEIVDFTADVVARRLSRPVPVFALSALPQRSRSAAFVEFAAWLRDELTVRGSAHAIASTRRVVRREATVLRDALLVEEELLSRRGDRGADSFAALSSIVDRVDAALDHLRGDARRLRIALDASHTAAITTALSCSARLAADCWTRSGDESPEVRADAARCAVGEAIAQTTGEWYRTAAADLDEGVRSSVERALETLRGELAAARRAAGELLDVELTFVPEVRRTVDFRTPSFTPAVSPGWEELVSTGLKRALPRGIRRRILDRELRQWCQSAVPRPFGRGRSALQDALREALRVAERDVDAARTEYLEALRQGLDAVRQGNESSRADVEPALAGLRSRRRAVDQALVLLRLESDGVP